VDETHTNGLNDHNIILEGDTRLELLGIDERENKQRIFLYFWIHTSFLNNSFNQKVLKTSQSAGGDQQSQDLDSPVFTVAQARQGEGADEPSEGDPGDLVLELGKEDVDRGRYKGCPFRKAHKVAVKLHYKPEGEYK